MRKVELLIKPTSYNCNLNCVYCFYKKTSRLYGEGKHRMNYETLEKLISEAINYSEGGPCIFSWQGGEPLLAGTEFFKKVIEYQKKYGKPGQKISNSIQTNGTLINEEWIRLFKEYNFFIGISLDGPREIHNYYRKDFRGKGSFNRVMEGLSLLKKAGVEFNILSTIGKETSKYPEKIFNFFLSNQLHFIQFIPAVDRDIKKKKMADFSVQPDEYGNFLCKIFDMWWNDGNPYVSIRLFDNIVEILLGIEASSCMFKSECGSYVVVESNGDVYPCDFFVHKEWKLGNIWENSFAELFEKVKLKFGKLKKLSPQNCRNCQWNFICNNGCLWFRWVKNGNLEDIDYFCNCYKRFFSYTIEKFKRLSDSIFFRNILMVRK